MRRYKWLAIAVLLVLFATGADAKIYLDVYGQAYKKITIGAPPFKGDGREGLSAQMAEALRKDLDFTGFFIVAPMSLLDRELTDEGVTKQEVQFGKWRSIGVELICKGSLQVSGSDVTFDSYLYDSLDGTVLLAKRYRAKKEDWKRLVHKLADDIVFAVTGERGIMESRIVFLSGARTSKDVYIADIDGTNIKRVTSHRRLAVSPSTSPDGRYLAYTSYREGRPNLYVIDIEKNREVYADRGEGIKLGRSWLNKSTLAYVHTHGKNSSVYAVDVERGSKRTVMSLDNIVASPSFSPDGTKMVFASDMHGSPQIFLKDFSSGSLKRLTYVGNNNTSPVFSPKGNFIAFVSKVEGSFEICIMNADGTNQRILTNGGFNDSPQFSPCGRYIIYTARAGKGDVIQMILYNGENKKNLKFTDSSESQPKFIP